MVNPEVSKSTLYKLYIRIYNYVYKFMGGNGKLG